MIRTVSGRKELKGKKLFKSTLGLFVWHRKFSRYVIRVTEYYRIRIPDSSYLSGCTFESTIVCTVRVSIVRLFKYEHQQPPINTLLSRKWEQKANFEAHDQACRLSQLAGPAGKNQVLIFGFC